MSKKGIAWAIFLLALAALGGSASAENALKPGEAELAPPTVTCLGVRWPCQGDDNWNARVSVSYRQEGTEAWREALPLFRVERLQVTPNGHSIGRDAPEMFAGSIFDLRPGTGYELKLKLEDPDGGGVEKLLRARTRPVPRAPADARLRSCEPGKLQQAVDSAAPGEVIQVSPGTFQEVLNLQAAKGTAERPIVIHGAEGWKTVLKGTGGPCVVNASGSKYIYLEKLVLQGPRPPFILCSGAEGLVVRRCRMRAPAHKAYADGIAGADLKRPGKNFYIADNELVGALTWPPSGKEAADSAAINICGTGHVVCHNRITGWFTAIQGADQIREIYELDTFDIYGNDCQGSYGSMVEMDSGMHNIRIFRNRLTDVFIGISSQPAYGGPWYIFRNAIYNWGCRPLK